MSKPVIQAKYEDLDKIAGRFEQQSGQVEKMRQKLYRKADDLQHSGWHGSGATAFNIEMSEDILPALDRLKLALEAASEGTLHLIQIYQRAEEEGAGSSRSVDESAGEPAPRVYIVNGINCDDPSGTPGSFQRTMKETMQKYGYPEDEIVALNAIYNTQTPFKTLVGVDQVMWEYINKEKGRYTEEISQQILLDLQNNPLAPGQKLVLVGHSGGGAVMSNAVSILEKRGYPVEFVATLGSPVVNQDNINAYSRHLDIRARNDLFGLPYLRSDEGRYIFPSIISNMRNSSSPVFTVGTAIGDLIVEPGQRDSNVSQISSGGYSVGAVEAHSSYSESKEVLRIFQQYYPAMNFKNL
jgi:WXG100 family type VII secretion target